MKVFKGIIFSLIAIVLILVIAFAVVINLTPRQLGIADLKIEGKTVEEMGIADTKIVDIYKSVKSLSKVNESDVVTNTYDEEQEKDKSQDKFSGSSLDGKDDYSSIISGKVEYDTKKIVEYDDVTLAYIFNNAVQNGADSSSDAVKVLKDANVVVKEITIGVSDGKGTMRIVSMVELGQYKSDIENALGAAKALFKVPEKVYIVSEISFTVDETNGKMISKSESVCVNGNNDDPVTKAILNVIVGKIDGVDSVDGLNEKLGEAVSAVTYNLGGIGGVAMDEEIYVYGICGVKDHKLSLVTHVK